MECFSHDMGPVIRMARPENPNEIDEYVNPFCTELDEIGSFQSYCIGHFEHEWLDALGQMIAEGRVPLTDVPRMADPTELRHMDSGYIHRMEFSRLDRGHFYADAVIPVEITVMNQRGRVRQLWKKKQWYRLRSIIGVQQDGYSISECGISIYNKDEANPGLPLSEYLIPVLDEAGTEDEADQMLLQYYPEALMSQPVNGRLLAERMDLQIRCLPLVDEKIMGKSIFYDGTVEVQGKYGTELCRVSSGTIILNANCRYGQSRLNDIISTDDRYEIKSKGLVRLIYQNCGWDRTRSYRLPGVEYPQHRLVNYELSRAIPIFEGRIDKETQEAQRGEKALKA